MIKLLPIYSFKLETQQSQSQVKINLESLIKKQKKNKKFEIFIQGQDWGVEEFEGTVNEKYFCLKRYSYFHNDPKFIVYKGQVETVGNGSLINCTFRYDFFALFFILLMFIFAGTNVYKAIVSNYSSDIEQAVLLSLFSILAYIVIIIGFNYRIKKVRKIFEKKLNISR